MGETTWAKHLGAKRTGREKTWGAKRTGRKTTRNQTWHPVYLSYLKNTQCEQKYALPLAVKLSDCLRKFQQLTPTYGWEQPIIHQSRCQSDPLTYGRGSTVPGPNVSWHLCLFKGLLKMSQSRSQLICCVCWCFSDSSFEKAYNACEAETC